MTDRDKIRMCSRYATEMRDFYQGCRDDFEVSKDNAVGVMKGVLQFLDAPTEEDNTIKELTKEVERLEGIEQERNDLKSQLEEYWHQDYVKEVDDALVERMRREMGNYV